MDFFPFFNRPYYYSQNRYINEHYRNMQNARENREIEERKRISQEKKREEINESKNEKRNIKIDEAPIFEIFGVKLFFDDILIVALIFFLYNEGVRDNLLFISLVLILLS